MTEYSDNFNNNEITEQKDMKKFVFHLYDENIDLIETLNPEEKNGFINQLIYNYRIEDIKERKKAGFINLCKKISAGILILVIGVPLLIYIINFSFDMTLNSYSKMEQNFEKLFE